MPLPLALAAATLVPSVLQSGFGIFQLAKGSKMAKNNVRPQYNIPAPITSMTADAARMAAQGLPQEQINQYLNQLGASGSQQFRQVREASGGSGANLLQNLSAINRNRNMGLMDLLSQNAQTRLSNMRYYDQMRSNLAGYQDKQWELNKLKPFYETAQTASAMQGAGLQNIMGGLNAFSQFGTNALMGNFDSAASGGSATEAKTMGMPGREGSGMGVERSPYTSMIRNTFDQSPMYTPTPSPMMVPGGEYMVSPPFMPQRPTIFGTQGFFGYNPAFQSGSYLGYTSPYSATPYTTSPYAQ